MKKIIGTVLVFLLMISCGTNVYAASEKTYEEVINEVNEKYDLDLKYIEVDATKVSVQEYEKTVFQLAKQQRELLNYISLREECSERFREDYSARSGVTKTRTKNAWGQSAFKITATYTDYGTRVSECTSSTCGLTLTGLLGGYALVDKSSPAYGLIDQGETTTVKYTATQLINGFNVGNVTLYAEFYAGE